MDFTRLDEQLLRSKLNWWAAARIENFYNRVRKHSLLDQLSTLTFGQLRTGS